METKAEATNPASLAALVVGALLAGFGLACLSLVYVQGTIYTREAQLTRERAEYQQQQISEMRGEMRAQLAEFRVQLNRADSKAALTESRVLRLMEPSNGRD